MFSGTFDGLSGSGIITPGAGVMRGTQISGGVPSSSVIVPVPADGEPSVALVGDARFTTKVSSLSTAVSCVVRTLMAAMVEPAAMVAVCAVVTAV